MDWLSQNVQALVLYKLNRSWDSFISLRCHSEMKDTCGQLVFRFTEKLPLQTSCLYEIYNIALHINPQVKWTLLRLTFWIQLHRAYLSLGSVRFETIHVHIVNYSCCIWKQGEWSVQGRLCAQGFVDRLYDLPSNLEVIAIARKIVHCLGSQDVGFVWLWLLGWRCLCSSGCQVRVEVPVAELVV